MNEQNNQSQGFGINQQPSQPTQGFMENNQSQGFGINQQSSQPTQGFMESNQSQGFGINQQSSQSTQGFMESNQSQGFGINQQSSQSTQGFMGSNQSQQTFNSQQSFQPTQGFVGTTQQDTPKKNNKIIFIIAAIVIVAIVAVVIFFLNSSESLVCTRTEDMYGMTMSAEVKASFKNDKPNSLEMNMKIELGDEYADYKDEFVETFEDQYSYFEEEGIPVEVTSDDSSIYIKFKADKDSFDDADVVYSETYEDAKKELEDGGWECK